MRYLITSLIFTSALAAIIFGTQLVHGFSEEMIDMADFAIHAIDENNIDKAEDEISRMTDLLFSRETLLLMFTDHSMTEELRKHLASAEIFAKGKENSLAASEIAKARELMHEMTDETKLSLGNVF